MSNNLDDSNLIADSSQLNTSSTSKSTGSKNNNNQALFCNICSLSVTGDKNYQSHLSGKRHQKNIEARGKKKSKLIEKNNSKVTQSNSLQMNERKMDSTVHPGKSLSLKHGPNASRNQGKDSHENKHSNYHKKNSSNDGFQKSRDMRYNNSWYNGFSFSEYNNNNYKNYDRNYNQQYQKNNYRSNRFNDRSRNRFSDLPRWHNAAGQVGSYDHINIPQYGYVGSEFNMDPNAYKSCDNEIDKNTAYETKQSDVDSKDVKDKSNEQIDSGISESALIFNRMPDKTNNHNRKSSRNSSLIALTNTDHPKQQVKRIETVEEELNEQMHTATHEHDSSSNQTADKTNNDSRRNGKNSNSQTKIDVPKQLEKKVVQETMSERISHWVNPLNPRDKAEVNKLVTEFSKSKKKENLLKLKQRSENGECSEENTESNETLFEKLEQLQDSLIGSRQDEAEIALVAGAKTSSPKVRKRKKSSLSESSVNMSNSNESFTPLLLSRSSSITEERKRGRKSRASVDSNSSAKISLERSFGVEGEDILGKRRVMFSPTNKPKKHKCSASQCLEKCVHEDGGNSSEHQTVAQESEVNLNDIIYNTDELYLKQEPYRTKSTKSSIQVTERESLDFNINSAEILNVDDLMKIFADKNVTIKKEFDDPLIDAIKNIDVDLFLNVCEQQQAQPQSTTELSQMQSSSSALQPSPKIVYPQEPLTNSTARISSLTDTCDKTTIAENGRSSSSTEIQESPFPGLSPFNVYVNISNELKKLQKEEEEKRNNLKKIDSTIEKFQKVLNDLKAQKMKLEFEEDNLINRRNSLTCALSQCITKNSSTIPNGDNNLSNSVIKSSSSGINNAILEAVSQLPNMSDVENLLSDSRHATQSQDNMDNNSITFISQGQQNIQKAIPVNEEEEEIAIIPKPDIPPVVIPVIDLVDLESPDKRSIGTMKKESCENLYDKKELTAHETVVNSLKVYGDFMYTCSNDCTAKRFHLKDCSHTVTYKHSKRNVLQLSIEIFNNVTLVFTLCSTDKFITSFRAEDGVPIKTYTFDAFVASISTSESNSWGKVFAGLKSGSVMVCSHKETRELVRNYEPIKSLSCTFQGGLRVLVILATNGQVTIRDVERNGLLIRYIKNHTDIPLFMNVYNDCLFLSSSVLLTVSDISNGTLLNKIKLFSPMTGLAAYENNIYTTSFSGIIRCYPDCQQEQMKMAYGAGKNALTCIYVHQGWVFTGNRNGEVAVFKFDLSSEFHCKFNKCPYIFTKLEDLERHLLNGVDHKFPQKPGVKCPWRDCQETINNKDWKQKDRKNHFKDHIESQR